MAMGFGQLADLRPTGVVLSLLAVLVGHVLYFLVWRGVVLGMWWRAWHARRVFEAQGVKCLPRSFFHGNLPEFVAMNAKARSQPMPKISHDIAPQIMPHLYQWSKIYGERFVYWNGAEPRYILTEPEQAKEVLSTKFGHFRKLRGRPDAKDLFGESLVTLEGEKWAQHRRIVSPSFFLEKLKGMAPIVLACTEVMMQSWEARVERKEAIDVSIEFRDLTADIIAHTAFGSSFAECKQVFETQHEQQILLEKILTTLYIPGLRFDFKDLKDLERPKNELKSSKLLADIWGRSCTLCAARERERERENLALYPCLSRFLPTAQNRYSKKLNKRIYDGLSQVIQNRMELEKIGQGDSCGNDLLGLMLAANKRELPGNQRSLSMGMDELIDECKTFFFAGHETTSMLLTFMFLLLGINPEWQERLREEVFEVCGKTERPTADSVNNLKLVGMVMNETLRLYPPAVFIARQTEMDRKVGTLTIPTSTVMIIPIIAWHHDERFWGPDANEFRPERFEDGILKACKVPGAYLPFSMGPRNCIGQVFATIEAKLVVSTILQHYRFRLSPEYVHAPTVVLTLRPQFGMPIIFEKL